MEKAPYVKPVLTSHGAVELITLQQRTPKGGQPPGAGSTTAGLALTS